MDNQNTNQNNLQIVEKQELTPEKSIDEKAKEISNALAEAQTKDDVEALYSDFKLTTAAVPACVHPTTITFIFFFLLSP